MKVQGKLFDLQEANQMLPLIKRIVSDILSSGNRLMEIEELSGNAQEKDSLYKEMNLLFKELEDLGCTYRDWGFSMGLVDFPSRLDGQNILLCWRSDEPEIQHFHSLEGGYANRVSITDDIRDKIGK